MAMNLVDVRKEAALIQQKVRQEQLISAVDALRDLLEALVSENLSRADRREMEGLAENGAYAIMIDPVVGNEFAIELKYESGKERELLSTIHVLVDAINERDARLAEEARVRHIEKLRKDIDEAIENYKDNQIDKAERIFKKYFGDFRVDPFYLVKIGLMYSELKLYQESIPYFSKAIDLNGREADWYNYIAISLRKVHEFEEAEQYYLRVSKILGGDPHLFFNLARLYLDWERWDKAIKAASASVKLDPDFVEAQKLIKYATKQAKKAEEAAEVEAKKAEEAAEAQRIADSGKTEEELELERAQRALQALKEEQEAADSKPKDKD